MAGLPYRRLAGFYFFYFATLGVLVPYWGLYLQSVGFAPADIGTLTAVLLVSRIVAPIVWGGVADHTGHRIRLVRVTALLTVVTFLGVFFGATFWWLAGVMLAFSFFWHAALPLLEVSVMNSLGARAGAYGRVRLWGSVGFIVAVVALGAIVDARGPWWVLPALLVLMCGIWIASLLLPDTPSALAAVDAGRFRHALRRPEVIAFLAAGVLMQAGHGPYYTFFSIYLESAGYTKSVIGLLWAFGVVCEIVVFLFMTRIFAAANVRRVLLVSFALASLRWLMIGFFPESIVMLVLAQTLHAASFATFHAASMQLVYRYFRGRHQHRGQAIYGGIAFGVGGAIGSFVSGYAWSAIGPAMTFALASAAAAAAFLVALAFIERPIGDVAARADGVRGSGQEG